MASSKTIEQLQDRVEGDSNEEVKGKKTARFLLVTISFITFATLMSISAATLALLLYKLVQNNDQHFKRTKEDLATITIPIIGAFNLLSSITNVITILSFCLNLRVLKKFILSMLLLVTLIGSFSVALIWAAYTIRNPKMMRPRKIKDIETSFIILLFASLICQVAIVSLHFLVSSKKCSTSDIDNIPPFWKVDINESDHNTNNYPADNTSINNQQINANDKEFKRKSITKLFLNVINNNNEHCLSEKFSSSTLIDGKFTSRYEPNSLIGSSLFNSMQSSRTKQKDTEKSIDSASKNFLWNKNNADNLIPQFRFQSMTPENFRYPRPTNRHEHPRVGQSLSVPNIKHRLSSEDDNKEFSVNGDSNHNLEREIKKKKLVRKSSTTKKKNYHSKDNQRKEKDSISRFHPTLLPPHLRNQPSDIRISQQFLHDFVLEQQWETEEASRAEDQQRQLQQHEYENFDNFKFRINVDEYDKVRKSPNEKYHDSTVDTIELKKRSDSTLNLLEKQMIEVNNNIQLQWSLTHIDGMRNITPDNFNSMKYLEKNNFNTESSSKRYYSNSSYISKDMYPSEIELENLKSTPVKAQKLYKLRTPSTASSSSSKFSKGLIRTKSACSLHSYRYSPEDENQDRQISDGTTASSIRIAELSSAVLESIDQNDYQYDASILDSPLNRNVHLRP